MVGDVRPGALPGCGLAVYAGLLLALFAAAALFLLASGGALLSGGGAPGPSMLTAGTEVAVWRLQPLRDAGVIGIAEVPVAFHDESARRDGTTACALLADRLVEVEDGKGASIALSEAAEAGATGVAGGGADVWLAGPGGARVTCRFGPGEGGERLLRQLQAEVLRGP